MEADRLRLESKPLQHAPVRRVRHAERLAPRRYATEQTDLTALLLVLPGLSTANDRIGATEQARPIAVQPVEGARFDQILHLSAIDLARIDPVREVGDVGEPRVAARLDHC